MRVEPRPGYGRRLQAEVRQLINATISVSVFQVQIQRKRALLGSEEHGVGAEAMRPPQ